VYSNRLQAYKSVSKATGTGRDVEAEVLTKAALQLKDCQNNWHAPDRAQKLDAALTFNLRVWSILQSELAKKDNPLPSQVKINLLLLSRFVDRRIFETLADPSPDKIKVIIDINHSIAAGLREKPTLTGETDREQTAGYRSSQLNLPSV
jgi:flagellar protein FlaF